MNLERLTASEAAAQIRSRTISPVALVRAQFRRIAQLDEQIGAWTTLNEESALAAAHRCEAEIRRGAPLGPLHGVPVGVKDIIRTKGLRTSMGSPIFENLIPERDARSVERLKSAGAIILGKTATTEFAGFDPGRTRNPWNPKHTPGGSSSGSAAAVAAHMCPLALGTQSVGSTGRPAAYCGIVGLVPTARLVSREGVFPVSWTLDHVGLFARTVDDAALLLSAVSETNPGTPAPPFRPRIGVVREHFFERATEETRRIVDRTLEQLASAGARVTEVGLPSIFSLARPVLMTIFRAEIAAVHEDLYAKNRSDYGPRLLQLLESGMLIDAGSYLKALRIRRRIQNAITGLFDRNDVLLTPAATGPAPAGLESTGDPAMNGPWTLTDFPTLTLPCALSSVGLPVAVQLVAPQLQEAGLLGIGAWCEEVIGFRKEQDIDGKARPAS